MAAFWHAPAGAYGCRPTRSLTIDFVWQFAVHLAKGKPAMSTASAPKRSQRLDARVTHEEKKVIETAASLRGISVTDFLRTSAKDAATQIIRENEVLTLAESSRKIFVEALLNPPNPNQKAIAAAKRLQQIVG
jgi:uncharacterized protein (DUF1778 family)